MDKVDKNIIRIVVIIFLLNSLTPHLLTISHGASSGKETLVPIPNTTVKLSSADDTTTAVVGK